MNWALEVERPFCILRRQITNFKNVTEESKGMILTAKSMKP